VSLVVVTGATGLIGQALVRELLERGDQVIALTRDPGRARRALGEEVNIQAWPQPVAAPPPAEAIDGADGVVNLLGEPVAQRWTSRAKARIRDSRVLGTRHVVAAIAALPADRRPRVLVAQSATGVYGPRGDEELDESAASGSDFLAEMAKAWEAEALSARAHGVRVVTTRTGVVLSRGGGALEKMLPPFRLGVGGPVAGGRQYLPWIHLSDVVGGMLHALDDERADGPLNLTAPRPVSNAEFSKALGRVLRRPAVVPVPALALRLLYGEMATIVLTGQRAVPRALGELGYAFRQPELDAALADVV